MKKALYEKPMAEIIMYDNSDTVLTKWSSCSWETQTIQKADDQCAVVVDADGCTWNTYILFKTK